MEDASNAGGAVPTTSCVPVCGAAVSMVPAQREEIEGDAGAAGIPDAHGAKLPPRLVALAPNWACRSVEGFERLRRVEEGAYGVVYKARDNASGEIVALKRIKMAREKEGFPITSLREIRTLLSCHHENVVQVKEIVVGSELDSIFMVMEFVDHDLRRLMTVMHDEGKDFLPSENLLMQLLLAVEHMHSNWIIHRDLKAANLLITNGGVMKVADFGLAREYGDPLGQYTPGVVTLWYRAPELLLGVPQYSTAVDMWAVGCLFGEFMTKKPIFPGTSEIDQLNKIYKMLGTPNERIWPGMSKLPAFKQGCFKEQPYNTLRQEMPPYLTRNAFDLLNKMLTYDPSRRISASEALRHPYFTESPAPTVPSFGGAMGKQGLHGEGRLPDDPMATGGVPAVRLRDEAGELEPIGAVDAGPEPMRP